MSKQNSAVTLQVCFAPVKWLLYGELTKLRVSLCPWIQVLEYKFVHCRSVRFAMFQPAFGLQDAFFLSLDLCWSFMFEE